MDPRPIELSFSGTFAGFELAFTELRRLLDVHELALPVRYNVELIFEEIAANIIRHGAPADRLPAVRVELELRPDTIGVTFDDDGIAFDPCAQPGTVPAKSLDEVKVGGLGLLLVRKAARSLEYERTSDNHNRLTVTLSRLGAAVISQ